MWHRGGGPTIGDAGCAIILMVVHLGRKEGTGRQVDNQIVIDR